MCEWVIVCLLFIYIQYIVSINCVRAHKQLTEMVFNYSAFIYRQYCSAESDRCDLSHPRVFSSLAVLLASRGNITFLFVSELCDQFPKKKEMTKSHTFYCIWIIWHLRSLLFVAMSILWNFDLLPFFSRSFHFFNWNLPLAYTGFDINNSPALRKLTANKSAGMEKSLKFA